MINMIHENKPSQSKVNNLPHDAKLLVLKYFNSRVSHMGDQIMTNDVYVVWFSKTLQNWKALVSTTVDDDRYYEVTHNGDKKETYIDVYTKVENIVVPD